ncbi:MAG: 50S ribosomal protein L6 [Candidatus Saccharicenans sp.]|nr:MAG: 50S ribosomal protein L6 [Candidatus Aminicenantes bacterium]HEK86456.1 50S ribosomal protein L6 [Candidatus Aminicenantes bacterium]
MSRVGKKPIEIPKGVKVTILPDRIEVEGKLGKLTSPLYPGIKASIEGQQLILTRENEEKQTRQFHGLCRALANNCLIGVTQGFSKQLEITGVGYRAKVEKNKLELNVGYSRPIIYEIPEGIEIIAEKPTLLTIKGIDKQKVGQVADTIKRFRRPDPYKQKGIRLVGEVLIKKERKAGVAGA